eukprot:COSAG01_NODE_5602_length_4153_cov_4.258757_1_plen_22_part_10
MEHTPADPLKSLSPTTDKKQTS